MSRIMLSVVLAQVFSFFSLQAADNQHDESCFYESDSCFIFYDPTERSPAYIYNPERCSIPATPCCSFNIALAAMGFDSGVLAEENSPLWSYEEGDNQCPWVVPLNGPISPRQWMQQSCVWYSQMLTRKLGMPLIQQYLAHFKYGNQDFSGAPGCNDGLKGAWISSSLKVTPNEQISFLNRLVSNELGFSQSVLKNVEKVMFIEELPNGWKLHGKTGTGTFQCEPGGRKIGWFAGWIEKEGVYMTFVCNTVYSDPALVGGRMARFWSIAWLKNWASSQTSHCRLSSPTSMHVEN